MQFISAHQGKLQTIAAVERAETRSFVTGLEALDALAPRQSFARGAVHELLFQPNDGEPKFVAATIASSVGARLVSPFSAKRATQVSPLQTDQPVIWSDPHRELYPPALASLGFDLSKVYLLHPRTAAEESWAITECLRCRGVGAVVASLSRVSRIEARRYQLAAERGGGVGIFLRPIGRGDSIYAAATRWLVRPHPGERTVQRWTIQLLHGHGGRIGQCVFVEWSREYKGKNNPVRAVEKLPDRSVAAGASKERAVA